MSYFITTREIRLLRGLVAEGEIITVPNDLDQDQADRLIKLEYIVPAEQQPAGDTPPDGNGLAGLKLDELKALAVAEGVDLGDAKTKAAIVEAIENARLTKPGA